MYLTMLREWADEDTNDKIADALTPPADWRDPLTGLPAGFTESDEDDWAAWESASRR